MTVIPEHMKREPAASYAMAKMLEAMQGMGEQGMGDSWLMTAMTALVFAADRRIRGEDPNVDAIYAMSLNQVPETVDEALQVLTEAIAVITKQYTCQ